MNNRPVLFFDSGIGGLAYLLHAAAELPNEDYVYVADRKNFPYGEKPQDTVLKLVVNTVGSAVSAVRPKAAVIACNTASVIALAALRREFDIPFIGVVPAIKPAAANSKQRKIGIFATSRTVEDSYTADLIRDFADDCVVISYSGAGTVSYIEQKYFYQTSAEQNKYVVGLSRRFLGDGIDSLVLGCTHFVYLAEQLQEVLKEKVEVIDSRDGVTRQLGRVLECMRHDSREAPKPPRIYSTADETERTLPPVLAERFHMEYAGGLEAVYQAG